MRWARCIVVAFAMYVDGLAVIGFIQYGASLIPSIDWVGMK